MDSDAERASWSRAQANSKISRSRGFRLTLLPLEPVFFHRVKIYIELDWIIEVTAGFCKKLAVAGILGRNVSLIISLCDLTILRPRLLSRFLE